MDELLLKWSRGKEAVKIGSEELGNKVAALAVRAISRRMDLGETNMSSRGEMKMSLRLMICGTLADPYHRGKLL